MNRESAKKYNEHGHPLDGIPHSSEEVHLPQTMKHDVVSDRSLTWFLVRKYTDLQGGTYRAVEENQKDEDDIEGVQIAVI